MALLQVAPELKEALAKRGGTGIRGIMRAFRVVDEDGNKKLSKGELKEALATWGLHLSADVLADAV